MAFTRMRKKIDLKKVPKAVMDAVKTKFPDAKFDRG